MCVTYSELTAQCVDGEPIIKTETLKRNISRGNIDRAHRGGGEGGQALIVYSTLPVKYRERFEMTWGDPEEIIRKSMIKESMKLDMKAREYYEEYTYDLKGAQAHLSGKLIDEYTINASVLNELVKTLNDRTSIRKALSGSMRNVWNTIADSCEALRKKTADMSPDGKGHTLPKNLARLKDKINEYKRDGYAALISGKIGNQNTLKITETAGNMLIALKRSRTPVYNDTQLFDKFNALATDMGMKPIKSLSGMKAWLNSEGIMPLWYDAVYGEQAARQKFGRKHRTALPSKRDTLWYGDGTKLNLYYLDDKGQVRTTCVYEVIDASSEVLLGYHISDSEDYEAQYHAYRMAIQISGHRPYEIVHDNQGGHKKLEKQGGFFDKICHVHRSTAPYNGESKTIENIFGRFQQQILHQDWRFTGQNVTTKKANSRPNLEFIEANKDSLYTLEELKDAYAAARKKWNEAMMPGTTERRIDRYNNSVNEETEEVNLYAMIDMFWIFSEKPVTFTDQGIKIQIKGKTYQYEVFSAPGVPDHEWRRLHTLERFRVAYDPYDLTSIRLYSIDKDGALRFARVAEPYMVIHRAIQEQTEGEARLIRQEQAANMQDRIEYQVTAKAIEYAHGMAPEQNGLNTPKLKGVTAEVQRQIDERTGKYSQSPEEYQLGRVTKKLSMDDWKDQQEATVVDFKKAASKL